jgi:S1-C subfamily serine protease
MNLSPLRAAFIAAILGLLVLALPAACSASPPYNDDVTYRWGTDRIQCSATAIGPHAVLVADHCVEGDVRAVELGDRTVNVVSVIRDGADHALVIVEADFKRWAKVGKPPRPGDEVYFQGIPRDFGKLLRFGRVSGWGTLPDAEADPVLSQPILYVDIQVAPGDSGAGLFNHRGELVGVVSIQTWQGTGPANFMGSLAFRFTPEQWRQAAK